MNWWAVILLLIVFRISPHCCASSITLERRCAYRWINDSIISLSAELLVLPSTPGNMRGMFG